MKEKEVRQLWKCVRKNYLEDFIFFCCYEHCGLNIYSRPLEDHHREGLSEGDQWGAAMHSGSAGPALTSRYLTAMLNLTVMTPLCPFFYSKANILSLCRDSSFFQPQPWKPGSWINTHRVQVTDTVSTMQNYLSRPQCAVWWLTLCVLLFREKFIRLQHENKMLRVQQEELEGEKIATLQAQLEEAHKTRSELDTENRLNVLQVFINQQQAFFVPFIVIDFWLFFVLGVYKRILVLYFLPLYDYLSADWVESGWVSCSSRWRTSRGLCRVRQPNLMMWVSHAERERGCFSMSRTLAW